MSDQDDHDYRMSQRKVKLVGTRNELENLLKTKKIDSMSQRTSIDPIEAAMRNNPGLTREKAEEMATKFGF